MVKVKNFRIFFSVTALIRTKIIKNSFLALRCYSCSVTASTTGFKCLLDPMSVEGQSVVNCNKKYCTILRQELMVRANYVKLFKVNLWNFCRIHQVKSTPSFVAVRRSQPFSTTCSRIRFFAQFIDRVQLTCATAVTPCRTHQFKKSHLMATKAKTYSFLDFHTTQHVEVLMGKFTLFIWWWFGWWWGGFFEWKILEIRSRNCFDIFL